MALIHDSLNVLEFARWRYESLSVVSLSFLYHLLSFLFVFHLRHSEDGGFLYFYSISVLLPLFALIYSFFARDHR